MLLMESDIFMDALNASATNKKEPKKRKRRISGSKDGNTSGDTSPPTTPTSVSSSPSLENKSVPLRFYQDTLDAEEEKEKTEKPEKSDTEIDKSLSKSPTNSIDKNSEDKNEISEPTTITVNGLKGVLCYHKKKGPKKSIKWKTDLEEIQYFELDETERVNVTKTFTDMKYLERIHEREAFQKARNLINDDVMEEKTNWTMLIPIDCDGQIIVEYGKNSKEKELQAVRQKGTLQPLYFHKAMIPDSPFEADIETHTYIEPSIIPLEDITGNQDNISDFRNMPWPEPKGTAPPTSSTNVNIPPMFQPPISQFPNNFPNPPFGVPGFPVPPNIPAEWQNGMPPHMVPSSMPPMGPPTGLLPPGPVIQGNVPPGIMMPSENMMMGPDMFNGPNPMFPIPPENFNMMENMNMQPNMFPPDFNMQQVMPGPDNSTGPNFRGGMRGRGTVGHWRGKGNWEGPSRGRGGFVRGARKALCIYFQRKGSCRQGENCTFLHPGVNCPF